MTFSQGSAAYILLEYDCGGISLDSTACGVWRHLFDLADVPGSVVAAREIQKLSTEQMKAFTVEVQNRLNHLRGDISEQSARLQAFALLCRVHEDWVDLRACGRTLHLPQWTLQGLEQKLGRRLGDDARRILQGAYPVGQEPRPFCLRDGLQIAAGPTVEPRGEIFFHSLVAVPLMQLIWRVLKKNPLLRLKVLMDSGSISVPGPLKPDILLCYGSANLMCAEVKASDRDIDEAWQEAMEYSMLLSPHANLSTMVMAVGGNQVRMGLLTLLDTDKTATVGADSAPRLPQKLPPELKAIIESAGITTYLGSGCTNNLKVLYGIEFLAGEVNPHLFDMCMMDYLEYVLQAITPGSKSNPVTAQKLNDHVLLYEKESQNLTFTEGSSGLIVKVMDNIDVHSFTKIHKLLKYTLHRYGSCPFTATDIFEVDSYFTCVMNYIPGNRFAYSDEGFAEVCAIVAYLHDELNICHGDLRRPNVIEQESGNGVRIIDWEYGSMINNVCPIHHGLQTVRAFNSWVEKYPVVLTYIDGLSFLRWRLTDIYAVFYFLLWNLPPPDDTQEATPSGVVEVGTGLPQGDGTQQGSKKTPTGREAPRQAKGMKSKSQSSGSTSRKRSRQNVSNITMSVQLGTFEQVLVSILGIKHQAFMNQSSDEERNIATHSEIIAKGVFSTGAILSEILKSVPDFSHTSEILSERWPLGGYTYGTTDGLRPNAVRNDDDDDV